MKLFNVLQSALFCFSAFLLPANIYAAEGQPGEAIFTAMKCTQCHGTAAKQRGPSLIKIANMYADTEELLLFFNGEKDSIVEPERAKTMRPRLRKIMKRSDADKKALAEYILGFKETP